MNRRPVIATCVAIGVLLELGIFALSGRRESWDSEQYWSLGIPLALVASAIIGFLARGSAWIWTLIIIPSQAMTMILRSGELSGLWPLTILAAAVVNLPLFLAAFVSSRFRPRWRQQTEADASKTPPSL